MRGLLSENYFRRLIEYVWFGVIIDYGYFSSLGVAARLHIIITLLCMVWFWVSGQMAVLDCLEVWYASMSPNYESGSAFFA